jgi:hypothetical protein
MINRNKVYVMYISSEVKKHFDGNPISCSINVFVYLFRSLRTIIHFYNRQKSTHICRHKNKKNWTEYCDSKLMLTAISQILMLVYEIFSNFRLMKKDHY